MKSYRNSLILIISCLLCLAPVSPLFCDEGTVKDVSGGRLIKRGDLLHISVIGHENLTKDAIVDNDGKITFPLLKEISAEGKVPEELAAEMKERLSEFIKYPQITVDYSNTFFVYGEVNNAGEHDLRGLINVLKAVIIAGGFTDFGSHKVKIIKSRPKRKDIWVDVDKIIEGKGKDNDILVEPGDIIVVPESLF